MGVSSESDFYRVSTGDTLYSIAWAFQLDEADLIRWNHLSKPYHLHYGQRLRIVSPDGRSARVRDFSEATGGAPTRYVQPPSPPHPSGNKTSANSVDIMAPLDTGSKGPWRWPAQGRVISQFSDQRFGEKGIKIAGTLEAPVRAAAKGVVVYCGAGLRAYGNLILVKHNQDYISAYAFNQRNLVKDGETVAAGQKIAEMGQDNSGRVLLYFELRRHGKPVDPLHYLKK
jgi:lipoprotein NlpD